MHSFDAKRLSLGTGNTKQIKPCSHQKPPHHRRGEKFLKGPVPLAWLSGAARLPGKALHVGSVLWFLAGLKNTRTVALPNAPLQLFGVDRHAKYRALTRLEAAGLVAVERHPGRNPRVTLLDARGHDERR